MSSNLSARRGQRRKKKPRARGSGGRTSERTSERMGHGAQRPTTATTPERPNEATTGGRAVAGEGPPDVRPGRAVRALRTLGRDV